MTYIDHGEEFRRLHELYAQKSDDELSAMANELDSLTEMAQQVLRDEISRRGIDAQSPEVQGDDPVPSEEELVQIWLAEDSTEAQEVIRILDAAGIPAHAVAEKTEFADGTFKDLPSVKVVKSDQGRAAKQLAPYDSPESEEREADSGKFPVCPKCHSSEIVFQGLDSESTSAKTEKYNWTCDACGHRWQDNGLEQLA